MFMHYVAGVASLVGRADALSAFLFVVSVMSALLARVHIVEVSWLGRRGAFEAFFSMISLLSAVLAALAKETGIAGILDRADVSSLDLHFMSNTSVAFGALVIVEFVYIPPPISSRDALYSSLWGGVLFSYRRGLYTFSICAGWVLRSAGGTSMANRLDNIMASPILIGKHPKKV